MFEAVRESAEQVEIGSALDIQDIAPLARPDIMLGAVVVQGVGDLAPVREVIGRAPEQEGEVAVQGLPEDRLRVRHHHDLGIAPRGDLPQQDVRLSPAEDLQVGIRFVHQQQPAASAVESGEQEEHLLHPAPGQRNVERPLRSLLAIIEGQQAAHRLPRVTQFHEEQARHQGNDLLPIGGRFLVHDQTVVPKHRRGLALS